MTAATKVRWKLTHIGGVPGIALLLVLLGATAWGTDSPPSPAEITPVNDLFAAWHARLDQRADDVLLQAEADQETETSTDPRAQGTADVALIDEPAALQQFAQRFWNGREQQLSLALQRVSELRPVVEPILKDEGLSPAALAVVLVESGGDATALSPRGARGLWQFMPGTAQRYGLSVVDGNDERLHVEKATRAAARYLRELYARFRTWPLALAAYNAGEGAVAKAVERARTTDFAALRSFGLLPAETSRYVPAVLAAAPLLPGVGGFDPETGRGRKGRVLYARAVALAGGGK